MSAAEHLFLRIFLPSGHRVLPLDRPQFTVGSGGENEIRVDGIPPLALRLVPQEGACAFSSLHPQAKVVLNGKRCEAGALYPGDRLELGNVVFIADFPPERPSQGASSILVDVLSRLCVLVAAARDQQSLLQETMLLMKEAFQGDEAFLLTLDRPGRPSLCAGTGRDFDSGKVFSDGIVTHVLAHKIGICLPNALDDDRFSGSGSISDLKLCTVLCAPILVGGTVYGAVYVGGKRPALSYSSANLRDLEVCALVAGCLLHNVGLIALQRKLLAMAHTSAGGAFIATGAVMERVREEAELVAQTDLSVLLTGETGTGKDVLARYIHQCSRRRDKPFMVVNCSTLRGELLASELFGHVKGAFTGAVRDYDGLFVAANGGTLLLDEIGELELPLQAMLLRVLETGRVRPVGRMEEIPLQVRVLCATNRDLENMVAEGGFRKDLYYRINQHRIHLPPLRERGEDILLLAHHFLEKARAQYPEKRLEGFLPESLAAMAAYDWPGNIRELANTIARAALFSTGPAVRVALPETQSALLTMDEATRRFQFDYLQRTLALHGGDRDKTAAGLGISRSTLFRYLAQGKSDPRQAPPA